MTKDEYKELRALQAENNRNRAALFRIMELYAKAPGWANPTPTTKLVWSMYQAALKAATRSKPNAVLTRIETP